MEFWGAEVKIGETLYVEPGDGMVLHLSQASLGEAKKDKGSESVCVFVNVEGKKYVLGTLFSDKLPQQQFDLVFDRDFELSHNWKNGSVSVFGYRASNPFDESDDEDDVESESDEDIPVTATNNGIGKPATSAKQEKPSAVEKPNSVKEAAAEKQKVKIVEPNKDVKPDEDDEDDDSDEMSVDESDSDENGESDSGSEEEEESEDEDTPKKVENKKKRASDSGIKTPGPEKKAKTVTPQKTDGKKGSAHVATPHPAKQTGKTPGNKSNQQTLKSGGSHSCKPCNRNFNSEQALDSHKKAKHSTGK